MYVCVSTRVYVIKGSCTESGFERGKSFMGVSVLHRNNNVEITPYNLVLSCQIAVIKYLRNYETKIKK